MKQKIVAISTTFNNTTSYVSDIIKGSHHNIISGTSTDPNDAYEFEDKAAAKRFLSRVNNPYNRTYKVASLTIEVNNTLLQDQRIA